MKHSKFDPKTKTNIMWCPSSAALFGWQACAGDVVMYLLSCYVLQFHIFQSKGEDAVRIIILHRPIPLFVPLAKGNGTATQTFGLLEVTAPLSGLVLALNTCPGAT